jgi:hypothetical protein
MGPELGRCHCERHRLPYPLVLPFATVQFHRPGAAGTKSNGTVFRSTNRFADTGVSAKSKSAP